MMNKQLTVLDVLKLIADDFFPIEEDSCDEFDTRPSSVYEVTLCFMCEEETWLTCNIQNEVLVPWYDCEVKSIQPEDNKIRLWLNDVDYLKKNYPRHIIPYKGEERANG